MSRDFTKEDIQMANKPMKRFAPLATRKKEIRTTMAKIKKQGQHQMLSRMQRKDHSYIGERKIVQLFQKILAIS